MATKCRNCNKPLTGKQRKWCKEACRKQLSRRVQSGQKKARQASGLASGFVRLAPGKYVEMRLLVESDGLYVYLYENRDTLTLAIQGVLMSKTVIRAIEDELHSKIPGYAFKVVVLYRQ